MTSVTSPQQTDRRGTDEIPGPRGGQGVRLLVLGTDTDSQDLRDRAAAAGYELAQRYSARVSHVAYGSGIDPADARYTKIRDAGLPLLPLQKCAEELGLRAQSAKAAHVDADVDTDISADTDVEAEVDSRAEAGSADAEIVADVENAASIADVEKVEHVEHVEFDGLADNEPLAIPPLHPLTDIDAAAAAAVIGADPWTGPQQTSDEASAKVEAEVEAETETAPAAEAMPEPVAEAAAVLAPVPDAEERSGPGHVLLSIVWALIPFATFGLLTPVTFGYAAYRLRSRALALTALAYSLAVFLSFALSAARPHSAAPSHTAGALLTVALAGAWIGGTLHALSIRTRVFAR